MKVSAILIILLLACTPTLFAGQEKSAKMRPGAKQETASSPTQEKQMLNNQQAQALQADVNKMRVLLRQMQNNMGAATSAQDPLKHQFELEIEMWQIVISDMERKLQSASAP